MAEGVIKKLVVDRGFGFIQTTGAGRKSDVFFHFSAVEGARFEDLHEGQAVEYDLSSEAPNPGRGKGPRAVSVRPK
ncbi:cold-shock protein [Thermogutta sp.]|jgi:CspA family cold shock protein|uniref:cold-shock protein n=1 Tax=Thermogutta sp. TaxID=1962930 RepID=UPI003220799D